MHTITRTTWEKLQEYRISQHTIILDIDGVLMADAEDVIARDIAPYVEKLIAENDVWIVSNTFNNDRRQRVAQALGIQSVDTHLKKPDTRIMKYIERDPKKPLVVIGDKYFTDGIFAWRIGARGYLITPRRTHANDRWFIRLTYVLDDTLSSLFVKS